MVLGLHYQSKQKQIKRKGLRRFIKRLNKKISNKPYWQWLRQKYQKQSFKKIGKLSKKLLILGASLYWGEGYKRPIIKNGKSQILPSGESLTQIRP